MSQHAASFPMCRCVIAKLVNHTSTNERRLPKVSQLAKLWEIGASKGTKLQPLGLGLAAGSLAGRWLEGTRRIVEGVDSLRQVLLHAGGHRWLPRVVSPRLA